MPERGKSGYFKIGILAISFFVLVLLLANINFGATKNLGVTCWGQQDSVINHVLYCNKTNMAGLALQDSFEMRFNSSIQNFAVDKYDLYVLQNIEYTVPCSTKPDSDGDMPNDCAWFNATDDCLVDGSPKAWCTIKSNNETNITECIPAYPDALKPLTCPADNRTKICISLERSGTGCQHETYLDEPRPYNQEEWMPVKADHNGSLLKSNAISYAQGETKTFKIEWESQPLKTDAGWVSAGEWSINPSGWWYNNWKYRRPITINNTGWNLTSYQIKINHDLSTEYSEGKINQTCNDLRFTYYNSSSGTETELPHWIAYCNLPGSNITAWVNVAHLQENTNSTVYMYYGNPQASSISNGENTFLFFDDFFGTSLNTTKWQILGASEIDYSVNNGILNVTSAHQDVQREEIYFHNLSEISDNYTILLRLKSINPTIGWQQPGLMISNLTNVFDTSVNAIVFYSQYWNGNPNVESKVGQMDNGAYTEHCAETNTFTANWRNLEIRRWNGTNFTFFRNGAQTCSRIHTRMDLINLSVSIRSLVSTTSPASRNYEFNYDHISIRKTALPEPTVSVREEDRTNITESEARQMIELGIQDSLGNVTNYTDQQVYARYSDGSRDLSRFDKVAIYGNQTWAFNYVSANETFTNMPSIRKTLNIWENQSLSLYQIRSQVSEFINRTQE